MSLELLTQLRRHEGTCPAPYKDSVGVWTWGVGHNLSRPLSPAVIDCLVRGDVQTAITTALVEDIADVRGELATLLPWYLSLSDARRGVLENMAFNLGVRGLLGFRRMLAACIDGEWDAAAVAMLDSKWARQVGPRRSGELATQLREDRWALEPGEQRGTV